MSVDIIVGDALTELRKLPSESVDCCVTSPPYWGLRDYDVDGQMGLEPTLGEHLDAMVELFREVRRVLKSHGTLWLNYGDCYAAQPNGKAAAAYKAEGSDDRTFRDKPFSTVGPIYQRDDSARQQSRRGRSGNLGNGGINGVAIPSGRIVAGGFLKPKDLCMVPNRLAIALQDDGWFVRSEIIWHKPNPMPESVYDRPTSAHEKVWLLTKSEEYFYNHAAIREPCSSGPSDVRKMREGLPRLGGKHKGANDPRLKASSLSNIGRKRSVGDGETRNARNVWTIAPKPFREAHFATFPPELAARCIKAGVPETVCGACGAPSGCGGICSLFPRVPGRILDPFGGAGTVGLVAESLGLDATLIELNPGYAAMARRRIGLTEEAEAA